MTIVVCSHSSSALDRLVKVVREAGAWTVLPVQWPDALIQPASVYILHSGDTPDDLIQLLESRPRHVPLLVIGVEPATSARPSLWLPELPAVGVLARMIHSLLDLEVANESAAPTWRRKSDMIIGNSAAIRRLLQTLDQLAPAQASVMITGESGVGKELVARALHFSSPRNKHPFVAINCAAIPENLFEAELFGYERGAFTGAVTERIGAIESADKGTLFLDEIAEMPLAMQAKLLRVLETSEVQRIGSVERRKVNFRLVAATNRTLEQEIKHGRFREDLYYRVQVYPLDVPPLRERPEDIPLLVTHQLSNIAVRDRRMSMRLTAAALEKLITYRWPGNVRELVNLLERAALLSGDRVIDAEHIVLGTEVGRVDDDSARVRPYRDAKAKFELDYYSQLLRVAGGNVSLAAKLGQKTRKEIYDALKRLDIAATDYRSED
ncbi:MAG: sigma-54 dependent transcriptional regulator [Kofleriaceae bacterium]